MLNVIGFKETRCKDCYKCVRACEVKAIVVKNGHAQIANDKCVLCGHCLAICPQNAKTLISDLDRVKDYIASGKKVVVSVAPSYMGILKYKDIGQVVDSLHRLGFYQVRETSEGAVHVTNEYINLLREGKMDNIITTCCPSVNDMVEIYYPSLVPYLAPVVSPMIAHGKIIKAELGNDIKVVFLGPCIAKKREAEDDIRVSGYVDAVLNFTEVMQWMNEKNINIRECESRPFDNPNPEVNRLYPVSNGVVSSVVSSKEDEDKYRKFYVHGSQNCVELLESMLKGEVHNSFIEMNMCSGGCIKGPAIDTDHISRFKVKLEMEEIIDKNKANEYDFSNDKEVSFHKEFMDKSSKEPLPSEETIRKILAKTGKTDKQHELNCGACGYSTCRDKAIAVYQGKAELDMCIPYMREQATSMSNVVLETSPNIIMIVDQEMKIIEFNRSAEKKFGKTRTEAKEMYLFELIDHTDFEYVLETHSSILGKKVVFKDWNLTVLANIVYIKDLNAVLGIFQDITREEEQIQKEYKRKVETIEMAQKVIDKQMMVAQEIAGLLGETTAETKVTLTKMRDTILFDGEDVDK